MKEYCISKEEEEEEEEDLPNVSWNQYVVWDSN
jgi:hypothetical protein